MPNQALVDALQELSSGSEVTWDNFLFPIPKGVVIVTTDTQRFKVGDGFSLYSQLPDGPSISSIAAGQANLINVLTELTIGNEDAVIIVDNEMFAPSATNVATIASRLASISGTDTIQTADMDTIESQFSSVDSNISTADNGKLVIVSNHKMSVGPVPEDLVVAPTEPSTSHVKSVGIYSDLACTIPVTTLASNTTYYGKVVAMNDVTDTDSLTISLTTTFPNTTISNIGDSRFGLFKIVVGEIIQSGNVTFTGTCVYNTETASKDAVVQAEVTINMITAVYGGLGTDIFRAVAKDSSGNIYACGDTTSEGTGNADALVVKFDANLNILAKQRYGGTNIDRYYDIAIDSAGNVICVGETYSEGTAGDALIVKMNSSLSITLRKRVGGSYHERFNGVAIGQSDYIICVGETYSEGNGTPTYRNAIIYVFDASLNISVRALYASSSDDGFNSVAFDSNNNIIAVGYTRDSTATDYSGLVVKYTSITNLSIIESAQFNAVGNTSVTIFYDVVVDSSNNIYCFGRTSPDGTADNMVIVKLNSAMSSILAQKKFSGANVELARGGAIDSAGNIYVVGSTESAGSGLFDALIIKLDSSFNLLTRKAYGGSATDVFTHVVVDSTDSPICVGYTNSEGVADSDCLITKLPANIPLGSFAGITFDQLILSDVPTMTLADADLTKVVPALASGTSALSSAVSSLTAGTSSLTLTREVISS